MMKVTKYVLEDLFDQYNKQFFDGILDNPQLATYIGGWLHQVKTLLRSIL